MKIITYLAGDYAALNSNVLSGGGTDDTDALQALLDVAKNGDVGVRLIMDGAALVRGLTVYANTVVECLTPACGFYLADHSDRAIMQNAHLRPSGEMLDENITLIGGTYNQNCAHQAHHIAYDDDRGFYPNWGVPGAPQSQDLVVTLNFSGVRRLTVRDLIIRDQRTFAMILCNWEHVCVENVEVQLPGRVHGQNQDGFHVFGPGRFLTMRNVSGRTSDDFICVTADERDGESSITDVLIDGVHLDDADQAIRLLCHKNGRLDRVVIKNVTGTYRSFGFFINPFYDSGVAKNAGYGSITIDTVDLRSSGVDYDYTPPFLFRVGGRVDNLTLRNITHFCPNDSRPVLDVGPQYYTDDVPVRPGNETQVLNLTVDGLTVIRKRGSSRGEPVLLRHCSVQNLSLENVTVADEEGPHGALVRVEDGARIARLHIREAGGDVQELLRQNGGQIDRFIGPDHE